MDRIVKLVTPYFLVKYKDDVNRLHLTVARNLGELSFYKERFEVVNYEKVS